MSDFRDLNRQPVVDVENLQSQIDGKASNSFATIAVSGQSNVVADSASDTLTLAAGSNVTITTDASTDTITIASTGGGPGLSDGDKGDVTVSSSGSVWTIDNDAVTFAKMQNVSATDKILGRSTAGAGDVEEITCTAAGRALLDDAAASDQRTTLGLGTADSPQFTGIELGHASDTTITRASAGNISVEGNAIYRAGGTDVPIADGGTGASTAAAARVALLPSLTGNTVKYLRCNAGETDVEWSAVSGSGDVTGPGSATDNAITRFDGTGGKTLQNSAATVSDDGVIRSATNSGANAVTVPLCNWQMITADKNLANSATEQAYFPAASDTLTLPTGVYRFEWLVYITGMSATSGNAALDPIGAGTAVTDRWGYRVVGIDAATPTAVGTQTGLLSVAQQTAASAVTGATATATSSIATGMFRISTGGTVIPSITLANAAAAVAKAGSYIMIFKIGESSETTVGAWT